MKQDAFSAGVEPGGLWHKNDIRILLCYILASVGAPLSRQDLSRIIQEKGLAKFANISEVFGTFVYLAGVAVLWLTVGITLVSLCLLTSLTEGSILAFRLVVIVKNRRLMGAGPETIGKQK